MGASTEFNGSTQYVDATAALGLVSANTVGTIAVWINPDTVAATQDIVNFDNATGWGVAMQITSSGEMRVFVGDGSGAAAEVDVKTGAAVDASVWQHWAVTQSGSAIAIYKNGVSQSISGTNAGEWLDGQTQVLDRAYIGTRFDAGAFFFDGKMRDYRQYNRALSAPELLTLASGKLNTNTTGLLIRYDLNGLDYINRAGTTGNATNQSTTSSVSGPRVFL